MANLCKEWRNTWVFQHEATTRDVRHAVPFTNSVPLHPFFRPHLWRWHAGSCGLHRLKMGVKGESTARNSNFRFHLSSRSVIQTFHSWKLGSFGGIQLRNWYISYGEIYIYIIDIRNSDSIFNFRFFEYKYIMSMSSQATWRRDLSWHTPLSRLRTWRMQHKKIKIAWIFRRVFVQVMSVWCFIFVDFHLSRC